MRAPDFWRSDAFPAPLLAPLGQLYGVLGRGRRALARPWRAPLPVVCIGNLTVGGAGKTPTVLALVRQLQARGIAVHCLTRGYGGRLPGPVRVDPAAHDAAAVGDEALLLAAAAPTWLARDRIAGARAAAAAGAAALILDDGFQNPYLRLDLALLVIDGGYGFGNGRLLPAGPLREPLAAGLARADGVIVIGADEVGLGRWLPPGLPRLDAHLVPAASTPDLAGRRVLAFAGIGRPAKFFASLAQLGAQLVERHEFADHHPYQPAEIQALIGRAAALDALCVTTEKDRVRLPPALAAKVLTLPIELDFADLPALARLLAPILTAAGAMSPKPDYRQS